MPIQHWRVDQYPVTALTSPRMTDWLYERKLHCPFCGESISIVIDTSAGSQTYIEDCQVCCQPMQIQVEADDSEIISVVADR